MLLKSIRPHTAEYLDCGLPEVSEMIRDPVRFYRARRRPILALDDIHRLPDPVGLLRIGADEFPELRIVATGSTALASSRKFQEALAGRVHTVWLAPVLISELPSFGHAAIERRLLRGGLPEALLAAERDPSFYGAWISRFIANDVQRVQPLQDSARFAGLFEHLLRQSGDVLDIGRLSDSLGINRAIVLSQLLVLEARHALTLLKPFRRAGSKEIVRTPKCYGFDTGIVSHCREVGGGPGADDRTSLWKHVVLEEAQAFLPEERLQYWREAGGQGIDFVRVRSREIVDAIECRWNEEQLDPEGIISFRRHYPRGLNFLVCPSVSRSYQRSFREVIVIVCDIQTWLAWGRR